MYVKNKDTKDAQEKDLEKLAVHNWRILSSIERNRTKQCLWRKRI